MTIRDLAEFGELSPGEKKLIDGLSSGTLDRLGGTEPPDAGHKEREVRAAVLRELILGASFTLSRRQHEKAVRISGAWVTGVLDLEGCRILRDVSLIDCGFESPLILRSAIIDSLFLDGSVLPGMFADRLEVRGSVFLRSATVNGTLHMPGTRIGGDLVLDGTTIANVNDVAIEGSNSEIRGDLTLRGAKIYGAVRIGGVRVGGDISAIGTCVEPADATRREQSDSVAMTANGARVEGDVSLRRARISGEVSMIGAHVAGDFYLDGGSFAATQTHAVTLNRAVIKGALFLREQAAIRGAFSLNAAHIGTIVDEPSSWPAPGDLLLNRCVYGGFLGTPVNAKARLKWLARQSPERWGEDFWPQPYEQLSAVLNAMGHTEDARSVLFEKERLQRRARRNRAKNPWLRTILLVKDAFLRFTVGYGVRSSMAFVWLGLLWVAGVAMITLVEAQGELRPNLPMLLRSPEWSLCGVPNTQELWLPSLDQIRRGLALPGQSQIACFVSQPESASFPKFNSWMYALDALIPGLQTGQMDYWSPDTRFALGRIAKTFEYIKMIVGWALSVLALASFSGVVKSPKSV